MKTTMLALMLLLSSCAFASKKTDPAEFTIKVHVTSSKLEEKYWRDSVVYTQVLQATIDGNCVQLQFEGRGVLLPGDYLAKLTGADFAPGGHPERYHPNDYDIYRGYELLLPDGTSRKYTLTGLTSHHVDGAEPQP